jgi:hypothetical protein
LSTHAQKTYFANSELISSKSATDASEKIFHHSIILTVQTVQAQAGHAAGSSPTATHLEME